jgi:hypothetical protein
MLVSTGILVSVRGGPGRENSWPTRKDRARKRYVKRILGPVNPVKRGSGIFYICVKEFEKCLKLIPGKKFSTLIRRKMGDFTYLQH